MSGSSPVGARPLDDTQQQQQHLCAHMRLDINAVQSVARFFAMEDVNQLARVCAEWKTAVYSSTSVADLTVRVAGRERMEHIAASPMRRNVESLEINLDSIESSGLAVQCIEQMRGLRRVTVSRTSKSADEDDTCVVLAISAVVANRRRAMHAIALDNLYVSDAGFGALASALVENENNVLRVLTINGCRRASTTMRTPPPDDSGMAALIRASSNVAKLCMSAAWLSTDALHALASMITHTTKLIILDIGKNNISNNAVSVAIAASTTIRRLSVPYTNLSPRAMTTLLESVSAGKIIERLDIRYNSLRGVPFASIARMLSHNDTLKTLSISLVGFTVDHVLNFSRSLQKSKSLTSLAITDMPLNDVLSFQYLAIGIGRCVSLASVYLGMNAIPDACMAHLALSFAKLTVVDLSHNVCQSASASTIAHAIEHSTTLTDVRMNNNNLTSSDVRVLARAVATRMSQPVRMKYLSVAGNPLVDDDDDALQCLRYSLQGGSSPSSGPVDAAAAAAATATATDVAAAASVSV
jgi:Leucine-rich repeat (LRR) protein